MIHPLSARALFLCLFEGRSGVPNVGIHCFYKKRKNSFAFFGTFAFLGSLLLLKATSEHIMALKGKKKKKEIREASNTLIC